MFWHTEFHVLENSSHGIHNQLTYIHTDARAHPTRAMQLNLRLFPRYDALLFNYPLIC